jgi:hypothetical protein
MISLTASPIAKGDLAFHSPPKGGLLDHRSQAQSRSYIILAASLRCCMITGSDIFGLATTFCDVGYISKANARFRDGN